MKFRKNQAGSALILSLWILAFLGLMASAVSFRAILNMKIARVRLTQVQARYLAKGGVIETIHLLTKENVDSYQTLNQSWANNKIYFKEHALGNGFYSIYYRQEVPDEDPII
ncbi:MAG: hypothetical protein Q8Q33_07725, partial [Chlamydiota bacterium]|nr:hypothetical protein [Chlamydiota bacterium]